MTGVAVAVVLACAAAVFTTSTRGGSPPRWTAAEMEVSAGDAAGFLVARVQEAVAHGGPIQLEAPAAEGGFRAVRLGEASGTGGRSFVFAFEADEAEGGEVVTVRGGGWARLDAFPNGLDDDGDGRTDEMWLLQVVRGQGGAPAYVPLARQVLPTSRFDFDAASSMLEVQVARGVRSGSVVSVELDEQLARAPGVQLPPGPLAQATAGE
jgi:hypothetical protein